MNNSEKFQATFEAEQLRARGLAVRVITDQRVPDTITTRDARTGQPTTHDLRTEQGRTAFALTLGLPAEQTATIADVIGRAGHDAKDELAAIAQQWAKAERGGQLESRLILSGHHVGDGVYGDNNGRLDWSLVADLARAMPRAARSVEDLLISGCFSGGASSMQEYQAIFPNVRTIVAYQGESPGAYSGATSHQKIWEQVTRGDTDVKVTRSAFAGLRLGQNVVVWTKTRGYDDGRGAAASIHELRGDVDRLRAGYAAVLEGRTPATGPLEGPARDFSAANQRLLQHPELTAEERAAVTAQRDQAVRLVYYARVTQQFAQIHGPRLAEGFRALGLPPPDFRNLTRRDALEHIAAFQRALGASAAPPAAAVRVAPLLQGLKELSPSVIPEGWV